MTISEFFKAPVDSLHPRVRDWKRRLDEGQTATLEVFGPKRQIGDAEPELYVQFKKPGAEFPLESVAWDDELNEGLISLKVRAINSQNESERFALGLRAAMRKIERRYGDGYFNAILLDLITDSDLTRHEEIAEVLKFAFSNPPDRNGKSYAYAREMIADAIGGRARELTEQLGYSQDEATPILVKALALYVDERFSISTRRNMGLL